MKWAKGTTKTRTEPFSSLRSILFILFRPRIVISVYVTGIFRKHLFDRAHNAMWPFDANVLCANARCGSRSASLCKIRAFARHTNCFRLSRSHKFDVQNSTAYRCYYWWAKIIIDQSGRFLLQLIRKEYTRTRVTWRLRYYTELESPL